jgi:hypothetical protein
VRDFKWGAYSVHISVSGLDHIPVTEFNIGLMHKDGIPPEERDRKDWIFARELGESLRQHIDGTPLRDVFGEHKGKQRPLN